MCAPSHTSRRRGALQLGGPIIVEVGSSWRNADIHFKTYFENGEPRRRRSRQPELPGVSQLVQ